MPIRVDEDGLGGKACTCKMRLEDREWRATARNGRLESGARRAKVRISEATTVHHDGYSVCCPYNHSSIIK